MIEELLRDLTLALPEVFLLVAVCGVLLLSVFIESEDYETIPRVTLLVVFVYLLLVLKGVGVVQMAFRGGYQADLMASVLKGGVGLCVLATLCYARDYLWGHRIWQGEYYVLMLSALMGASVLVSAHNLPVLYLGLELMSLSLYALVAMSRRPAAVEAGMKYFVLGAISSGIILYGFSLIYGLSASLEFSEIAGSLAANVDRAEYLASFVFAMVFILAGIAFKLGVVPFHMWVPDVYQGAPLSVTLFISSASKLAAFGLIARLLYEVAAPVGLQLGYLLVPFAVLSMFFGNIVAIAQSDLRRMLAYSTIAHMGFMLLGPIAGGGIGFAAAMFYVLVYALMSVGAFGLILALGRSNVEAVHLEQYAGLARRDPVSAALLGLLMFSLAGVPPFAGFWAKWFVLLEVVRSGYILLAVAAVLSSVIGVYFYLRLVKLVFFDEPGPRSLPRRQASPYYVVLSCNVLLVLCLGLWPAPLMDLSLAALGGGR